MTIRNVEQRKRTTVRTYHHRCPTNEFRDRPHPARQSHTLARMDRIQVNIEKEWLTVADVCEYLDVSTFVVTSLLRSGEMPAVKVGREWRVARVDFEGWLNTQRARTYESSDSSV